MLNNKYLSNKNIVGIDVYLEYRKTRKLVGRLIREKDGDKCFVFTYDKNYIYTDTSIQIGPELPFSKQTHKSKTLFKSFKDRIPSRENIAYKEYCDSMGISDSERNKVILLATIGRRGPSSFTFEPVYNFEKLAVHRKNFRKELGLTIREFAAVFDFSTKTIQRIEGGDDTARDSQKRMDNYILFPEIAIFELHVNGGVLMQERKLHALKVLEDKF